MQYIKKFVFLLAICGFVVLVPQIGAMKSSQVESYTIDFETLGYDTEFLHSPYSSTDVYFGLPADWQLTEGASIQLNTTTVFSGVSTKEGSSLPNGVLEIFFNDVFIEAHTISAEGSFDIEAVIPPKALLSLRPDGRHHLRIVFDTDEDCRPDVKITVAILNSSAFILPYENVIPPTDLSRYPYPIYQRSFIPDSALVVVPAEPTAAEMQAALSIVAGLGHQTDGNLDVTIMAEDALTPAQMQENDLIIVGNIGNSSLVNDLVLPVPLTEDGFAQLGAEPDDGIVQLLLSPWNETNMVMVVTGATDEAIIKAGQAISEGDIQPYKRSDVAVITAVEPQLVQTAGYREEQTFADLGYKVETLHGPGSDTMRYYFYIPSGYGKDGDSFVDISYAHSALLDNTLSGLFVRLNKELIGSARFDSENAGQTSIHIPFPDSMMKTGWNELVIEGELFPYDVCADSERKRTWLTIYPESTLNLSLKEDEAGFGNSFVLAMYPEPFTLEPTLGNVAIILPDDDPAAWETAGTLLFDLGNQAAIPLADFAVAFADAIPEELNETYEWILVGQPIDLPILQTLGDDLPAPFIANSNKLAESAFPVSYQVPDGRETGFLELLRAPDDATRTIIAILGNSDDSVRWAAEKLIDPSQHNLNGNFALVTDSEVSISNTAFEPVTTPTITTTLSLTETVTGNSSAVETLVTSTSTDNGESPDWLLPVLMATAGLIVLILVGVAIYYLIKWMRRRRVA